MDPEPDELPDPRREPRGGLALNWESAAKIGAGLLLAIALLSTLPALMRSDKPAPLEPDVGLPQAAPVQPAAPAGPDPAALARRAKAKRLAARGAAEKRQAAERRARRRRSRHRRHADTGPAQPAPVASAGAIPPSGEREKFGFETP